MIARSAAHPTGKLGGQLLACIFVDRLEEMLPDVKRTQLEMIYVIHDEFSMKPKRTIEITNILRRRGLNPTLIYDSRATDLLYDGLIPSIAEFTGQFLVGAECGYDEGLKRIGKGTTVEILENAALLLHQQGLAGRADFSFSTRRSPWESAAEVRKTCQFAAHLFATYGVRLLLQNGIAKFQAPGCGKLTVRPGWSTKRCTITMDFFEISNPFRSGVKLTPAEIWEISGMVAALQSLARVHHPNRSMVE